MKEFDFPDPYLMVSNFQLLTMVITLIVLSLLLEEAFHGPLIEYILCYNIYMFLCDVPVVGEFSLQGNKVHVCEGV
jgi:hypothetical protein